MAIGTFGSLLDTMQWDSVHSYYPAATQVSEGLILIANLRQAGHADPGIWLYLVSVDADGILALEDSRYFDANGQTRPSYPVLVDGTIWAIAYSTGITARLATFDIAGDTISAEIDSVNLNSEATNATYQQAVVNVRAADGGGSVFLCAGTDDDIDGWMESVIVQDDGTCGALATTWEYDIANGRMPALLKMSDARVAFVWAAGSGFDGKVEYIDVAAAGTFAHQDEELGIFAQRGGSIARVGSTDYYVIVSDYNQATVMIDLIDIPLTGSDNPVRADSWFPSDTTADKNPQVFEYGRNAGNNGSIFLLTWGGAVGASNCCSFEVLDTGDITKSFISTFLSIAATELPAPGNIVKGIGSVCVVIYEADDVGDDDVGYATSVDAEAEEEDDGAVKFGGGYRNMFGGMFG